MEGRASLTVVGVRAAGILQLLYKLQLVFPGVYDANDLHDAPVLVVLVFLRYSDRATVPPVITLSYMRSSLACMPLAH